MITRWMDPRAGHDAVKVLTFLTRRRPLDNDLVRLIPPRLYGPLSTSVAEPSGLVITDVGAIDSLAGLIATESKLNTVDQLIHSHDML